MAIAAGSASTDEIVTWSYPVAPALTCKIFPAWPETDGRLILAALAAAAVAEAAAFVACVLAVEAEVAAFVSDVAAAVAWYLAL
tara:strand:- start:579 stop:830 length:252 start_codon:yes stop_codon:yes gene_type:complete